MWREVCPASMIVSFSRGPDDGCIICLANLSPAGYIVVPKREWFLGTRDGLILSTYVSSKSIE